jgi:hypothetical protein
LLKFEIRKLEKQQLEHSIDTFKDVEIKFQELLIHLTDLIKFNLSNNQSIDTNDNLDFSKILNLLREKLLIFVGWLRLITESFLANLNSFKLSANFVNILLVINSYLVTSLATTSFHSKCFLFFIQNDEQFCDEYVKFILTFLNLIDKYSAETKFHNETEAVTQETTVLKNMFQYVIKCLYETNMLLVRQLIGKEQSLKDLLNCIKCADVNNETLTQLFAINFKVKLVNLCKLVKAIEASISKHVLLYEFTLNQIIYYLCNDFGNDEVGQERIQINTKLAELFKVFDMKKSVEILNKYFEVI